jgi:hypothetical protein
VELFWLYTSSLLPYHKRIVFKVHGLFITLSTFNWRRSPKSLSSAETDLVESTTVQQLSAGVTTKKLILDIFSIRPNCQPRVSRWSRHTQVMLQTVTLFYIHCGPGCPSVGRRESGEEISELDFPLHSILNCRPVPYLVIFCTSTKSQVTRPTFEIYTAAYAAASSSRL